MQDRERAGQEAGWEYIREPVGTQFGEHLGEEWVDKAFVHRCGEYGQTKVIGCRPSNYEGTIELNQNATQGELTHM